LVVKFEIIEDCLANALITNDQNKYLAIVVTADGIMHVLSKKFEMLRMVRIFHGRMITAIF
jgi:hypothetical protein